MSCRVTIIADASHCPKSKAAAYAFSIVKNSNYQIFVKSFDVLCNSPTEAEVFAIINALFYAVDCGYIFLEDKVTIQTDCEQAIFYLTRKRESDGSNIAKAIESFLKEIEQKKIKLKFKHIRGHKKFASNLSDYLQSKCDKLARDLMRKERDLKREQLARTAVLTKGVELYDE